MVKKYYSIIGKNGIGVYDNYPALLKSQRYVQGARVRPFQSYEAAEDHIYANGNLPIVCDLPDKLPINRILYFKNLI